MMLTVPLAKRTVPAPLIDEPRIRLLVPPSKRSVEAGAPRTAGAVAAAGELELPLGDVRELKLLKTTPLGIVVVVPTPFLLSVPRLSKTAFAPPQYWKSWSPGTVNTPWGS